MSDKRIVSTLVYPARADWNSRVETITGSRWRVVRRMMAEAQPGRVFILDGSVGIHAKNPDLAVAALLGLRRRSRRPRVVMAEANWKPDTGIRRTLRTAGMRAIARAVDVFCVVSRHEEGIFADTWGLRNVRVAYTPFYWTLSDEEVSAPTTLGGGVFAGGNPLRDYATLIEAVRFLDVPVTLATSRPDVVGRRDLPSGVTAGRIAHDEFMARLRDAGVVVVPLQAGTARSGGEQTYLNAMAMGKPVIVTDSPGVRDYITDGLTGIIVPPGDVDALRGALRRVLDPQNREAMLRMGAAAREHAVAGFGPQRWVDSLLAVADDLLGDTGTT